MSDQDDTYNIDIAVHRSLSQALSARKADYTRPSEIRIKIGSWNVAALDTTENDLGSWFVEGKGIERSFASLHVGPTLSRGAEGLDGEGNNQAPAREAEPPADNAVGIAGGEEIGLYALGLQEVVDVNSPTETLLRQYDPTVLNKWKKILETALPNGYKLVAEQQLIGLLLLVYASPTIASTISSVSTTSVGTGLLGYLGNKGAVAVRLLLGETTRLVFINSHLSAGAEKASLDRRNWDAGQVISRTKFDAVDDGGGALEEREESIGDEDFAWFFGDLNYRLEGIPGDDVRRLLMLHAPKEYVKKKAKGLASSGGVGDVVNPIPLGEESQKPTDSSQSQSAGTSVDSDDDGEIVFPSASSTPTPPDKMDPHLDPASILTTISSLLPHDQLRKQQVSRKVLHDGWCEGPITFLPTYKYDVGTVGIFDSSEKKRSPSWCDRILFRSSRDREKYEQKVKEEEEARKKDEEMKALGIDKASAEDDVLFDYDPETDGLDYGESEYNEDTEAVLPEPLVATGRVDDKLQLDFYNSHQRIVSSDHKPLTAIFTLSYNAVIPDLKSKIQQEVARELDRAENEGRPGVTIVVDHQGGSSSVDGDRNIASGDSAESIDFGDVKYGQSYIRGITVANTGRVPAAFSFARRPAPDGVHDEICRPWLSYRLDPLSKSNEESSEQGLLHEVLLEPGDAVNISLELLVDDISLVRALNNGKEDLVDVLVLRVREGRDHFLPVRGTWMPTCFGRSIEQLIRIPEGGARGLLGVQVTGREDVKWSAPRELFRLTAAIEEMVERAVAEWGMTQNAGEESPWDSSVGWPFAEDTWTLIDKGQRDLCKYYVREALDTDKDLLSLFPPSIPLVEKTEALASTLVDFLASLENSIITPSLWSDLEYGLISREKSRKPFHDDGEERAWILDTLATKPSHNISFVFLTTMLSRVIAEVAPSHQTDPMSPPSSPIEPSHKPKVGAKALSQDPMIARRQLVERSYAAVFAPVVIAGSGAGKKGSEDRRREVVEVFLRGKWDETS
jgi:inositol polyphosphate 5-phosphatase INPP5B/F